MQPHLPWSDFTRPSRARNLTIAGRDVPVVVARHRLARRYIVRVSPEGCLRLTVPRGASIAGGVAFAARQSAWIARELARHFERHAPWGSGTLTWFRGERVAITVANRRATFSTEVVELTSAAADVRPVVEARFRELAHRELPDRCRAVAAREGLDVGDVRVRNQRSRWGACSPRGLITLNWRLVQMPPDVSDYVIVHELMHLRQPNHSRRFWREVDKACRWWRDAERWLRRHGRELLP